MELKPGYKQTEVGVIPEDWDCVSIRSAASNAPNAIVGGPFGSDLTSADYVYRGVPVVRGTNMGPKMIVGPFVFVSASKAAALSANLARPRDVIFTQRGTLGQVSLVPDKPFESYLVSQSQMKVSLDGSRYSHEYVYHYFSSASGQKQILDSSIQTGVPHTNLGICKKYFFPAPTLLEQEAISEILNDIDSCIEAIQRLVDKKKQVKQAAMQELLTGKRRLPGFEGEWEVKRLGDVLKFQVGCPFSSAFFNDKEQGVRLVKNRDLKSDDQVFHYLSKYDQSFQVMDGDVLVGMDGDFFPCRWGKGPALLNQRVGRIVPLTGLNLSFAFYYLVGPLKEIESATSGTTVKHLSHGDIEGIEKPLPSVPEQSAIASVLIEMDAELAVLQQRLEKSCALKQGMMQQLLTGKIRLK